MGLGAFAQSGIINQNRVSVTPKKALPGTQENTSRNMTCTNDTLYYSYMKEAIQATPNFGYLPLLTGSASMLSGYSQTYTNSASTTITGVSFWGMVVDLPNPAQTLNVTIGIYNVNATNQPTTSLGTTNITVTGTVDNFYNANFSSPITVTADYAVIIRNTSTTDTLGIILNNAATTTYAENLASVEVTGVWYTATALYIPPAAYEAVLSPIVTYPVATDFTTSPATICQAATVTFTNTTTATGHLLNRMYNWNVFRDYFNYPSATVQDSTYAWDMGDGSALQWSTNAAYTYPASGLDTVTLYTLGGLFTSCLDTKATFLNITPNAVASFTENSTASPLIAFTSTSTDAVTYAWDFGDGSPVDNTANPSHTFSPGTWTVTLTVTSAGGCNTSTSTSVVTVISTGITNATMGVFNVYPNPSNSGLFTLDMFAVTKANIEVYNMIGELVYSTAVASSTTSLDLSRLGAGVYSMKVISNDKNIVKQIVITK